MLSYLFGILPNVHISIYAIVCSLLTKDSNETSHNTFRKCIYVALYLFMAKTIRSVGHKG